MSDETTKKQLPAKVNEIPKAALAALREGNVAALVKACGENPANLLAHLAIELRRESVAVLGNHEAFVRHTSNGSLRMVIRPVRLSMADGTIYKIPKRQKIDGQWQETFPPEAIVTYDGYNRQNAVAGCAVGQPPSVVVDGEPKTNPYVERAIVNGRLGDIVRVVVGVTVVGPAPSTGNPVVVTYTLDYDPSKDLLHQLAKVAEGGYGAKAEGNTDCYLIDEVEYLERKGIAQGDPGAIPRGWKFTPLFGGVGYLYNLGLTEVRKAYKEFLNIVANAVKKAQTVARRNAMRSHPAFVSKVVPDVDGVAVIGVIGWGGDESAMKRWTSIQERLAHGQNLDLDDAEVIDVDERYEATEDEPKPDAVVSTLTPEQAERNNLIDQIDKGVMLLPDTAIGKLEYDAEHQTVEQLRGVLKQINGLLDTADGGAS